MHRIIILNYLYILHFIRVSFPYRENTIFFHKLYRWSYSTAHESHLSRRKMSVLSTVSFLIATGTILSTLILLYLQILIPAHAYDSFILHLPQLKLNIHNTDGTRIQVGMNPSLPYHTNILPNDNSRLLGNTEGKGTGSAFARSILDGSVYF